MIVIRQARPDEAEIVADVLVAAGLDAGYAYDTVLDGVADPTFLAVDEGTVVGAIEGRFDAGPFPEGSLFADVPEPRSWIDRIGVVPIARRRGVARLLLYTFLREATRSGCRHVGLTVDQSTVVDERMEFFRSCGLHPLMASDAPEAHMGAAIEDILITSFVGTGQHTTGDYLADGVRVRGTD